MRRVEADAVITGPNTAPGDKLPLDTDSGGLSYMHCCMYGMYALQASVRQMRGSAPGAKISVCHGAVFDDNEIDQGRHPGLISRL